MSKDFKQRSASSHDFAMVPRADIPRSSFRMQKTLKTTFDAGWLVPMLCEEVLPGDTFNVRLTAFARLATPIFPFMDNLHFETFFFFVPNRLVWTNWVKFMGEQDNPSDSISFAVPQQTCPNGGYAISSLQDYFGLPTVGQVNPANNVSHSALPLRAYNQIWNAWFRDENIQNSVTKDVGDGPDTVANYVLKKRGKRKDYFTGALPWVQKFTAPTMPLGTSAPVNVISTIATGNSVRLNVQGTTTARQVVSQAAGTGTTWGALSGAGQPVEVIADLSAATSATINQLRQSFQIQKLLERDARGGTRYTEIVRSHFGVVSPDARLQRPEYLGGGRTPISVNAVAQTSATGLTGGSTPGGNLNAFATMAAHNHGFTQSFTEHGYVIGLMNVYADLTYQQGLRKHWSRSTRYDFYFPAFAMLGEQPIYNREIYCRGEAADANVFGYQERWAEYRYNPSEITGLMRSTAAGTIDPWHLSQRFTSLPTLNATFIEETLPVDRVVAVPSQPDFLFDGFFDCKVARPLPMYSVPGLIDHF